MNIRGGMPVEETVLFGGEQFDRTDVPAYGDLLGMVDGAKKQIELLKNVYTGELNGLEKRRYSLKTNFTYNVVFFIILILFINFFSSVMMGSGGVMMQAFETWAAIAFLIIAFFYMLIRVIKAYIIYKINVAPNVMSEYVKKHNLHTMVEEEEYCRNVLKQMLKYEAIIARIEKGVKEASIDSEAAMDEISCMNFDIPEFKYNAGRSVK